MRVASKLLALKIFEQKAVLKYREKKMKVVHRDIHKPGVARTAAALRDVKTLLQVVYIGRWCTLCYHIILVHITLQICPFVAWNFGVLILDIVPCSS